MDIWIWIYAIKKIKFSLIWLNFIKMFKQYEIEERKSESLIEKNLNKSFLQFCRPKNDAWWASHFISIALIAWNSNDAKKCVMEWYSVYSSRIVLLAMIYMGNIYRMSCFDVASSYVKTKHYKHLLVSSHITCTETEGANL